MPGPFRHFRAVGAALTLIIAAGCDSVDFDFPEGKVFFDYAPIDLAGVAWMQPMGGPNVFPRDHGGFSLLHPYTFPPSVPVLAVADGVVIKVSNGTREVLAIPDAPEAVWGRQYDDHLIEIKVSETITVNYAHVTAFGPALQEAFGDMPKSEEGRDVELVVQAGDTLGFVGPHAAMDFSVTDWSLDLNFLHHDLYPKRHRFAAHWLDYYQAPLRSQIEAKAMRALPPRAGKIDYDREGRIVGNWFEVGTTSFVQNSRQLAIVYHDIFGDRITIADGSPMRDVPGIENPGGPDVWWVVGNSPKPEDIGVDDGVVKYILITPRDGFREPPFEDEDRPVNGVALVEMLETGRIRFQVFKGVTDAAGFTSAVKTYVRDP